MTMIRKLPFVFTLWSVGFQRDFAAQALATSPCEALTQALGARVFYPGDARYDATRAGYFSAEAQELAPACVVYPSTAQDVSEVVTVFNDFADAGALERAGNDATVGLHAMNATVKGKLELAIKSGGHGTHGGFASTDGGVVLDFADMEAINVSEDRTIVSVEPGNQWGLVSKVLDPLKLAVASGRVADVGVGGVTLGGGLSFFLPHRGFVCDSVRNFEVVLASGEIVNANKDSNPELWRALKGGGNNFGVVTRFDLEAFEQGDVWGGNLAGPIHHVPQLVQKYVDWIDDPELDESTTGWLSIVYSEQVGGFLTVAFMIDLEGRANSPRLQSMISAVDEPVLNSLRTTNLTDVFEEIAKFNMAGLRQPYFTTTVAPDVDLLMDIQGYFNETLALLLDVENFSIAMTYMGVPASTLRRSEERGGNSMGLSPEVGTQVVIILAPIWTRPEDDDRVHDGMLELIANIDAAAERRGQSKRWRYLNYSHRTQDPVRSFGRAAIEELWRASTKYDPNRFFQKIVAGGFKLPADLHDADMA